MTLAIVDATASFASSTAAITPAVPDGAVGDQIVWVIGWGTPTAASIADRPVPSGGRAGVMEHSGSAFGGGGTYGLDTGPRGLSFFRATASSASGAVDATTFTNTGTGTDRTMGGIAIRISKASGVSVSTAFTSGADTTAGDAWAPAGFTNVGAAAGDLILAALAGIPDTVNPTTTVAWPGATLGTQATVRSSGITSGNDLRMSVRSMPVTAGTSSGAPTAPSATTGLSGVQGILRLREVTNVDPVADAGPDQSDVEPYSNVTLDGSGSDTDGTVTSLVWTGAGADPATIKAPGTLAGTVVTETLTATDNNGATDTDTMTVTVLGVNERAVVGGVEVPVEIRVAVGG